MTAPAPTDLRPELRVLLAGGGSGGSATPVLAVAQEVRRLYPRARFLYVGTRQGPEAALAASAGIPFEAVSTGKLRRYWDRQNLTDPFRVLRGIGEALLLARRFQPKLAFAAGGFASVPPIVAARLAGARTLIHQQDVEPGLANRLLVPFARRITVALPGSLAHFPPGRSVVTGNPVRPAVLRGDPQAIWGPMGLDPSVPLVLVTGGGTGALGLNRLVAGALDELLPECQVLHLTGRGRAGAVAPRERYRPMEFLVDEMPSALAAAAVVVTRAGMGTLAELAALGKPSVLVPMPRSHQWANARAFQALGAVEIVDQETAGPSDLAELIRRLLRDDARRAALGAALHASMPTDAAERVARELLQLDDLFPLLADADELHPRV